MDERRGTLTILRTGRFVVRVYGDKHCGAAATPEGGDGGLDLPMLYSAEIKCSVSLDSRGFLFDQLMVDKYFHAIGSTELSCEQLAIESTRGILALIQKENAGCGVHSVRLTLSPEPFDANMTFSYEQPSPPRHIGVLRVWGVPFEIVRIDAGQKAAPSVPVPAARRQGATPPRFARYKRFRWSLREYGVSLSTAGEYRIYCYDPWARGEKWLIEVVNPRLLEAAGNALSS